jgi:acyl-CoA synthetase (AMP-forming)/AMP-acid ligase II
MSNGSTPLWDLFNEVSLVQGDKPAIIHSATGESLSYSKLRYKAVEFSEVLNLLPYKAIVIVGEPDLNLLPIILSAAQLGISCVPLSDSGHIETLTELIFMLPVDCLVLSTLNLPSLKEEKRLRIPSLNCYSFVYSGRLSNQQVSIPYLVTHSSGSTGRPKPIAINQATKITRTQQSIRLFGVKPSDVILSVSPLHHSLGQRHFFLAVLTGATLVKAHPFRVDKWIDAVRTYRPSLAIPVATHLKILKKSILSTPHLLESFRILVTSSAPAEPEFKKQILDKDFNTKQKFSDKHDNRVVYSSTLVDVAANMELLRETAEWVNFILDNTFWQIRLLSKGNLIHKLVEVKLSVTTLLWDSTEHSSMLKMSNLLQLHQPHLI